MTARERILALRLLELQKRQEAYAKQIGIQVTLVARPMKKPEVHHD